MSLYHFCAPQFLDGIREQGLILGGTPLTINSKLAFLKGTQWLTTDGSFDQSWNGRVNIKYDRCAYRFDVNIPDDRQKHLWTWPQLKRRLQISHGVDCILEGFDDPEFSRSDDWRIYLGIVRREWLGEITPRPGGPNSDLKAAIKEAVAATKIVPLQEGEE